jgi:hypothetical protein
LNVLPPDATLVMMPFASLALAASA